VPKSLSIFLLIICFIFLLVIIKMVRKKEMQFKQALLWFILDVVLTLSIVFVDKLRFLSDFIGIEKISNMIFLFGFLVVLFICILLTAVVSELKNKTILLTQKLGILDNKVRSLENEKDNKQI